MSFMYIHAGISLGFENYESSVDEGSTDSVCIEAKFPFPDIQSFFVLLNTRSLTAGMHNVNSCNV